MDNLELLIDFIACDNLSDKDKLFAYFCYVNEEGEALAELIAKFMAGKLNSEQLESELRILVKPFALEDAGNQIERRKIDPEIEAEYYEDGIYRS